MPFTFRVSSFSRDHVIASALLFNIFSSYYLGQIVMTKLGSIFPQGSFESSLISIIYPSSIIISAILTAIFLGRTGRIEFPYMWAVLGIGASILVATPLNTSFSGLLVIGALLGASLGMGAPSVLNYFKEAVPVDKRGKIGGIALFATMCLVPLIFPFMSIQSSVFDALILTAWRSSCLPIAVVLSKKSEPDYPDTRSTTSLGFILKQRVFILYFAAWFMFSFLGSFETAIVISSVGDFRSSLRIIEPLFAAAATLVGGVISDWVGRKRVLIFGFLSLGIAYATVGLLGALWFSWLMYFMIDGIAFGLLSLLFLVVLWGDISPKNSERFYAIGVIPFFLSEVISVFLAPYLAVISPSSAFSLASFFLFLAVLPLLYAPETLPEKKIRDRELKIYIDKALKVKEKYS